MHLSDHRAISVDFTLKGLINNHASIVHQDRMKFNIRTPQINEVLKDTKWPHLPFVEVAKGYKFTQVCKFKQSDAHYVLGKLRRSQNLSDSKQKK